MQRSLPVKLGLADPYKEREKQPLKRWFRGDWKENFIQAFSKEVSPGALEQFLNLSTIDTLDWIILHMAGAVLCIAGIFSSIPGL